MNPKTKNIILWTLTALVAFIFLGSAYGKITGAADAIAMANGFGISESAFKILGGIELAAVVLFIIPRTALLGFLLLVAYMGGAIATHLEHQQPVVAPLVISSFIWIVGFFRFPELSKKLVG
jgi:hypothetical protein